MTMRVMKGFSDHIVVVKVESLLYSAELGCIGMIYTPASHTEWTQFAQIMV